VGGLLAGVIFCPADPICGASKLAAHSFQPRGFAVCRTVGGIMTFTTDAMFAAVHFGLARLSAD